MEEVLPEVGNTPFDLGLSGGIPGPGGIDDNAPVAGILIEGPLEDRVVAVSLHDGRFHVVHREATRHTREPKPGVLQTVDDVGKLLGEGDLDVLVAAVDQNNQEGPGQPAVAGLGVRNQTQPAEVQFGQLPRFALRHPNHRPLAFAEAAMVDSEPVQRAVGDLHPPPFEELPDLGVIRKLSRLGRQQLRVENFRLLRTRSFKEWSAAIAA